MKIAIIGAGFGGLTAGLRLAQAGQKVTIFEADSKPGGLAIGFKEKKWKWSIEKHYHHLFTNDNSILDLAKEVGHEIITTRPKTSTFINGKIDQLDSPFSLLTFDKLPIRDRLRVGLILFYLKTTPFWKPLERLRAKDFLVKSMGENAWKILWEPLFSGKFHAEKDNIPASWFWARIKKRTPSLSYPKGGFLDLAVNLVKEIEKHSGEFQFNTKVVEINKLKDVFEVQTEKNSLRFDRVISTLPFQLFTKIVKLPRKYTDSLESLTSLGAVNMLLSLNRNFLEDDTYWLNINAHHFPFLSIVEHTNFMDKKFYGNEHLLYIGNYLPRKHSYFRREAIDLLKEFYPYMKTINPKFDKSWVNKIYLFKAPFAQPIMPLNYSQEMPTFQTGMPYRCFRAENMRQAQ